MKFKTQAVQKGVNRDGEYNSVITPIYPTSNFRFTGIGEHKGFDYTRSGNPTRLSLEENLAALEGGTRATCTCTGMAAVTAVLHLLKAGDHVVAGKDIYSGTYRVMSKLFSKMGITFDFTDIRDTTVVRKLIRQETKMIWYETPSNPLLNIIDIEEISRIAKEAGCLSVMDNTFATPYLQRPLELGTDIVVHSTTKYINGHSDVVGGVVISKDPDLGASLYYNINALGISEAPFDAWLVLRGVKTLPLRMEAHNRNAMILSEFLQSHGSVKKVYYPGLKSHEGHEIARKQMSGFGGMLSFELDTTKVEPEAFLKKLKYYALAESLGGVESLVELPWYMSHASIPDEARIEAGITKGLVRISAGIEDPDDLVADMAQALE